jgi:uncharacterized short protein YbdD (DUF466 family)
MSIKRRFRAFWNVLRTATGDDAYERYLVHWLTHHRESEPLSRRAFVRMETQRKWDGVRRCC